MAKMQIKKNKDKYYLKWKRWDKKSHFGNLSCSESSYFDSELSRISRFLTKNSKVLEVGFGNGNFLKYAKINGWDSYGIESNFDLVRFARQNGFNANLSKDLTSFPDSKFDLIVAFDVLEHFPQHLLLDFLLDVKRTLKKGGHFIARFPNGDSPFGLRNQNGDITHLTTIGSGKVKYFAELTGMEIIFIGDQAQPIFGMGILNTVHRIFSLPTKKIINLFVNLIFFPGSNLPFCASNIVVIYRVIK